MIRDFSLALAQMGDPRFRRVLWRGVGLALLLLAIGSGALLWLLTWALPDTITVPFAGEVRWLDDLAGWAAAPVLLILMVILMVPVASAISSLFLDEVAEAVEDRHYPGLPRVRPQGWGEAIREAARAFGVLILANLLALVPFLLLPPLAPIIFVALNGYLLGREYFHVAALRRESPEAARALMRANRGEICLTGCLMAVPLFVPVLNLVIPTLGAATFTHLYHRLKGRQRI